MAVSVSGMFGKINGQVHTYFADSPVVIDISGLEWSRPGEAVTSPFTIVRVEVVYNNNVIGDFREDTGGQTEAHFDISSALKAIWSDFDFNLEVDEAKKAAASTASGSSFTPGTSQPAYVNGIRKYRSYYLRIYTEYLDSTDNEYVVTQCKDADGNTDIPGGQCLIGGLTEWERSLINDNTKRDVSALEHSNTRNGDASTKPAESPERVGQNSITSWVDVTDNGTKSVFYPATFNNGWGQDDYTEEHAPIVLRDNQDYIDFLFLNRRGAIETCSGMMKEAMNIDVDMKSYTRIERPTFKPSRSLMAIGNDGRRSWQMSSGYVTREWAEWWTMEFLGGKRKRWWMKYKGPGQTSATYIPVIVEPAKKSINIYDKTKQQMPHVDFTVTLALEG